MSKTTNFQLYFDFILDFYVHNIVSAFIFSFKFGLYLYFFN